MVSKGNKRKHAKRHGFRVRQAAGGKIIKARRSKGRKRLAA